MFECQQALEKLLKAIWVEQAPQGYPPREHNLVSLAEKVGLQLSAEQLQFLDDLSRQYKPTRYADAAVEYSVEEAENYYRKTEEQFAWLRQQLS
ncbi:MAG: HEPN domain-containing protein [Dehalococcoidia bacterium]